MGTHLLVQTIKRVRSSTFPSSKFELATWINFQTDRRNPPMVSFGYHFMTELLSSADVQGIQPSIVGDMVLGW